MRHVIHLMPYDGIGGVERAAATAEGVSHSNVILERMFVFETVQDRSGRRATFNPWTLWKAAGRLARAQPDLVVLSLWRAVLVGGIARLRGCRAPMVLFLHNARDAHRLDKIVTRAAAERVVAIWADSAKSLEERLPYSPNRPARIISYLLDRPTAVRGPQPDPKPDLIFWGRLAAQKDPLRMLAVFAHLHDVRPDATLTVIGPDGGLEAALRADIARRGLQSSVTLTGPLPREEIGALAGQASFYLQTSRHEGMALSVVEAMQAGLVPVVTPVGEIERYTRDGINAVWIALDGPRANVDVAERIDVLLNAPHAWQALRASAVCALNDRPIYSEDIITAALEILDTNADIESSK